MTSVRKIAFATSNPGKIREAAEILGEGFEIVTAAQLGITEDIPETGTTLRANSLQKAKFIYEHSGVDCFADDTGLEVDILGGEPGIYTARYAGPSHDFDANMDKLLLEMSKAERSASIARLYGLSTPKATRKARFRTCVTLILDGKTYFFDGVMEGRIARKKAGNGGFGYDPVFIPDEADGKTAAEISEELKNAISHRGKALREMAKFLENN